MKNTKPKSSLLIKEEVILVYHSFQSYSECFKTYIKRSKPKVEYMRSSISWGFSITIVIKI